MEPSIIVFPTLNLTPPKISGSTNASASTFLPNFCSMFRTMSDNPSGLICSAVEILTFRDVLTDWAMKPNFLMEMA